MNRSNSPQANFAIFITSLMKEKQITQEELASILGNKGSTICRWEKGEVHPDNVDLKFIREIANLKECSLDDFDNFIYEVPVEFENYIHLKPQVASLPVLDKIKLLTFLSQDIDRLVAYSITEEFRLLLNKFLEQQEIDYLEAARITGIMPPKRFYDLLNGMSPEKIDLIKLATCNLFRKENGDRYSFQELEAIVFGK